MLEIKIKRFDKNIPLPAYKTSGAAALDLYTRVDAEIEPGEVKLIPLNIALEIPTGHFVLLVNRSSTYKLGITCVNGVGIGDSDFCGDNDEYHFPALNFTKEKVVIPQGTRIGQMLILPVDRVNLQEVDKFTGKDRGSFGSTGVG